MNLGDEVATPAAFMSRVVAWPEGPDAGFINLHTHLPGAPFKGVAVQTLDAFMREVEKARDSEENIYFCLSQQSKAHSNGNGHLTAVRNGLNATAMRAIWIDLDVGPDKPYHTSAEAIEALKKFLADSKMPPASAMVASGSGGFHVYWISKSLLIPGVWRLYAEALKALASLHGLQIDGGCTADAARVLRVPGTLNFKHNPPRAVKLMGMGEEYELSTIEALQGVAPAPGSARSYRSRGLLPSVPARFKGKKALIVVKDEDLPPVQLLNPLPILQGCAFLRKAFQTGGKDHDQPLWHQAIRCATYLQEGNKFAHRFSDKHEGYKEEETEEIWERVSRESKEKDLGWPQCSTIKDNKCKECEGCPFFKEGKSPLNLALRTSRIDVAAINWQVREGKLNPVTGLMTLCDQGANINTLKTAMNQTYAVVRYGGQIVVAIITDDALDFMTVDDFHKMFENLSIDQSSKSPLKVSRAWFAWKERRQYLGRGVVFEPGGPPEVQNDKLNLWRGFGVKPKQGDWSLVCNHIRNVICSGNEEHFRYFIKWMAYAVQHLDTPIGVAVAFIGAQGAGKGVVARTFGKFFGNHFVHITHGDRLTGRFNASLGRSCAVFLDEALWAGDRKGEGVLKALITEPSFQMEAKHRDEITVHNRLRIMVASNNDWAVPAGAGDRRWFVLNVANTYAGTGHSDYWAALYAEIDNGGAAAMLHDLLATDLADFDVRSVPHTKAKAQQQALSFRGSTAWLYDILQEGAIGANKWNEADLTISKDKAYECYKEFSKERREWQPDIKDSWSKNIRKMLGPCVEDARPTIGTGRVYSFRFAPLADCRHRFEAHVGAPNIEWEAAVAPEPATDTTVRQTADHLRGPTVLDTVDDAPSIECEPESEPEDWPDYELNCEPKDEPEYESEDGSH